MPSRILTVVTFISISSFFTSATARQRTFIMVKPDGVERGLVGKIITRFEEKGLKLIGMKFMQPSEELLRSHYSYLAGRSFLPQIINYLSSKPVVAMAWEGNSAVKIGRNLLGATGPADAAPGTVRGDYGIDFGRNLVYGTDHLVTGESEIALWFKNEELISWTSPLEPSIYEL